MNRFLQYLNAIRPNEMQKNQEYSPDLPYILGISIEFTEKETVEFSKEEIPTRDGRFLFRKTSVLWRKTKFLKTNCLSHSFNSIVQYYGSHLQDWKMEFTSVIGELIHLYRNIDFMHLKIE